MGLKYGGIARQAADSLLEQNITKRSIISLIPRPKTCFDESLCGCVSGPTASPLIFQRRVIRAGALRPELVDC